MLYLDIYLNIFSNLGTSRKPKAEETLLALAMRCLKADREYMESFSHNSELLLDNGWVLFGTMLD